MKVHNWFDIIDDNINANDCRSSFFMHARILGLNTFYMSLFSIYIFFIKL